MAAPHDTVGGRAGLETRAETVFGCREAAPATDGDAIETACGQGWRHDGPVSTRTLVVLAAACAIAILAASAIQILLAR